MDSIDEAIHQPVRLKIMAALKVLPDKEAIDFVRLRALVGATEGNLGAHLATLEKYGYIDMRKEFIGKKPRTSIAMTTVGRRAFDRYVSHLRAILDGTG